MAQRYLVKWLEGDQIKEEILYGNTGDDPDEFASADQLAAHLSANPDGYTVFRDGSVPIATSHMIHQAGLESGRLVLKNSTIINARKFEGAS